jgi:hypothetical protein
MQKRILACALLVVLAVGEALAADQPARKASPDKMQTATGTVSKVTATERQLLVNVGGTPTAFVWTAETKINGTLSQGAKVTVRYTSLPDGQNLAHQISVGH